LPIERALAFVFLTSLSFALSTPQDLYKEAQLQETVSRDCDAAIRLYEKFLTEKTTARVDQAQALLRLGQCRDKLGRADEAQVAWKKIVQEYFDQPEAYAQALKELQKHQPPSPVRIEVRESTPIVKVVYDAPPPRWLVEFPRGVFVQTLDGKGDLTDNAAGGSLGFVHFPQPHLGVGFEVGNLGNSGPPTARRSIAVLTMLTRAEKPWVKGLTGYLKGGPGIYMFTFDSTRSKEGKINIGAELEAGLVVGLLRGFTFNFGYALHGFGQSTPSKGFVSDIPAADRVQAEIITQNRGIRFMGGPIVSLSFRW